MAGFERGEDAFESGNLLEGVEGLLVVGDGVGRAAVVDSLKMGGAAGDVAGAGGDGVARGHGVLRGRLGVMGDADPSMGAVVRGRMDDGAGTTGDSGGG